MVKDCGRSEGMDEKITYIKKFEQGICSYLDTKNIDIRGKKIIVALSGGADSVCLLRFLHAVSEEYHLELSAVHVHHGIRKEADIDVEYSQELCASLGIPIYVEYRDIAYIAKEQKLSVEEAGRKQRYLIFDFYLKKLGYDLIAIAHHTNDRVETMLFQLFRGSGLKGLIGIREKRNEIIRPLLNVTRKEIEKYLALLNIKYITDSTNLENAYSRNKIRNQLIPLAEEISNNASLHMAETINQLNEIEDYLSSQVDDFCEKYIEVSNELGYEKIEISLEALRKQHIALKKAVIVRVLEQCKRGNKDIASKHIKSIVDMIEKNGEKRLDLPNQYRAVKSYDVLKIIDKGILDSPPNIIEQSIDIEKFELDRVYNIEIASEKNFSETISELSPLKENDFSAHNSEQLVLKKIDIEKSKINMFNIQENDCRICLDCDKIATTISLRTRRTGDYIIIDKSGKKKTIQAYMIDQKIPKEKRDNILLLAKGNHVIWIVGKRVSEYYKVGRETKRILLVQIGG